VRDWSLQELHRLFRAEARVAEQDQRTNNQTITTKKRKNPGESESTIPHSGNTMGPQHRVPVDTSKGKSQSADAKGTAEMELKHVSC